MEQLAWRLERTAETKERSLSATGDISIGDRTVRAELLYLNLSISILCVVLASKIDTTCSRSFSVRCFFSDIEARNYREIYKMHKIQSLRSNEYEINQDRIGSEIFIPNPILLSFVPQLRTVHAYTVALTNRMYCSIALAGQNIISLIDHFYQFLEPVFVKWASDITREMYGQLGKRYRTIVSTDSSFLSNKLFQYKVHLLSHSPVKGIVIYPHLRLSRLTKHTLPETFIAQCTIGRGAMMARFKSASRRRSSTFTTTTFSSVRHPWNVLRAYKVYKLDN